MSKKPDTLRPSISATQKATLDHVNALIQGTIAATLDAATSKCNCSTCQTIRKGVIHVRALMDFGPKIKHIEAA